MRIKRKELTFNDDQVASVIDDSKFSRLYYVRYADDFLIGIIGPKKTAVEISDAVIKFLQEELELQTNKDKTKIIHSSEEIIYLGTLIK